MKATPLTPADIFGNQIRYVVPLFQRPYVWTQLDQWEPLWDDIQRVAEAVLAAPANPYGPPSVPAHFLGAVVVEMQYMAVSYIGARGVIDGQQRMTTLQLLLDAAHQVVVSHGAPQDAQALQVLILNQTQLGADSDERFKVWPTDRDRSAFRAAMDDEASVGGEFAGSRIVQAHAYFAKAVVGWALEAGEAQRVPRLHALTLALRDHLRLVVIDLEAGDNAQVIFETLNHRGAQLLAADLIKNLVFQTALNLRLDVEGLYRDVWSELDSDHWRERVAQGRLFRPRIDVFMQYWLTMRRQRDVATDRIFVEFRDLLLSPDAPPLVELVQDLVHDARTFASLERYPDSSAVGRFRYRVLRALDTGAVTPILLWLDRRGLSAPPQQRDAVLGLLESWLVRRTITRQQAKDLNRMVVELLTALEEGGPTNAAVTTENFLVGQTLESRAWPSDRDVVAALTGAPLYHSLTRPRMRMLLEALEDDRRSSTGGKTEPGLCPRNMTVEHVLPQTWEPFWPLPADVDETEASASRTALLHTLGNLTLVTKKLNPSMSNAPWSDEEAADQGLAVGKRAALASSILLLNGDLQKVARWDEHAIVARGRDLAERVISIWPVPAGRKAPASVAPVPDAAAAPVDEASGGSTPAVEEHERHGRSPADWEELVQAALTQLGHVAAGGGYTTYSELNRALTEATGLAPFDFSGPDGRAAMGQLLHDVVEADYDRTGAMLSSIVLYLNSNEPGPGFYSLAGRKALLSSDATKDDRLVFWVEQVQAVHGAYGHIEGQG